MRKGWKAGLAGVGVAAVLLAGGWQRLAPAGPETTTPHQSPLPATSAQQPVPKVASPAAGFRHHVALGEALGPLPSSLQGTRVDGTGTLQVDAEGHLRVTVAVRHLFDYFLSALGEEGLDAVKGRIALHLQRHLPPAAALEGWQLLERYLAYRRQLAGLEPPSGQASVASLRQAIEQRRALRTTWLGPQASDAFFGPETAYDAYTLERLALRRNDQLTDTEKQQRLQQLQASLPAEVRRMVQQTMAPTQAARQVRALRAQGASEARVQAYRAQTFGPQAAARLERLDQQRHSWQARYRQYRQQRTAIMTADLAAGDKKRQIQHLRARLFDSNEQKRVAALDQIAGFGSERESKTESRAE